MTLQDLKDQIQTICLQHNDVKTFDYGEDFQMATGKGVEYPLTYLEIPYSFNYELATNRFKTVQFALWVLNNPSLDDVVGDHQQISNMETIADAIITRMQDDLKPLGFRITSVNGISVRNSTDDNVSGVRLDIQGDTFRAFCKSGYQDQFNIPE